MHIMKTSQPQCVCSVLSCVSDILKNKQAVRDVTVALVCLLLASGPCVTDPVTGELERPGAKWWAYSVA